MRSSIASKLSPRRSKKDTLVVDDYKSVLTTFCRDADVLIIPVVDRALSESELDMKTSVSPDGDSSTSDEDEADDGVSICGNFAPPVIHVGYEWRDGVDSPVSVICKAFYVEYALIQAIFCSLPSFASITVLKIEDCCISKEIVRFLSTLLNEPSGSGIVDLSLDGNTDIASELPLLFQTNVRFLSLRRCSLNNEAVTAFAEELHYKLDRPQNLLGLNLNMNLIGDKGVMALARALRSNRTLISLSLCGNQITDVGAMHLAQVIRKFALTHEEIVFRRQRNFKRCIERKSIFNKHLASWKMVSGADVQNRSKHIEKVAGKKTKSSEAGSKRVPTTANHEKRRSASNRPRSKEKLRGSKKNIENLSGNVREPSQEEMEEIISKVESEMENEVHPLVTEVKPEKNKLVCSGCWRLGNLNLAYNRITVETVSNFLQSLHYQELKWKNPYHGLLRLIIQPGNLIPWESLELAELDGLLALRVKRTGAGDSPISSKGIRERFSSISPKRK